MNKTDNFKLSRRELLALGLAGAATTGLGLSSQAQAQSKAPVNTKAHIVIVGAGAGGLALANRLVHELKGAKITLIDPRVDHYYQPGLSLVGAGLKPASYVTSKTKDWVSSGIDFIAQAAVNIDPEAKKVATADGQTLNYDFLVVAPGLVLDNDAIEGFSLDLIGKHGIGGLYAGPEYAERTWQAASKFIDEGGVGIFTRPNTEMKCAGAPLKHTFLIDDLASRGPKSGSHEMNYLCPQSVLFSVPIVAEKVRMLYGARGIDTGFQQTLTAIEPGRQIASFKTADGGTVERPYDYLHVVQPQRAPDVIRESGLSWADKWVGQGWVECSQQTLQHLRYPEVYALGDVAGVPKGKTAASVKWQAPVVADHLIAAIQGREGTLIYDGYTSCPMITRVGQAMLVEFDYHDNLLPSFPGLIAPLEELWFSWLMKVWALKPTYNAMLQGKA